MGRQAEVSVLIFVPFTQKWGKWSQARGEGPSLSRRAMFLPSLCLHYGKSMTGKIDTKHPPVFLDLWAGKQHDGLCEHFLEVPPFNISSFFCRLTSLMHQAHSHLPKTCPSSDYTAQLCRAALPPAAEQRPPEGHWKDTALFPQSQCLPPGSQDEQLWDFIIHQSLSFLRAGVMRHIWDIAAQQHLKCHQEEQIHLAGVNSSISTTSFPKDSEGLTDCRPRGYNSRLTNTDTAPWSI